MSTTETITWISVTERLPDSDRNVIQWAPGANPWPGYLSLGAWYHSDGYPYGDNEVTHWAEMPMGPR
jgi:hypothetical protein